MNPDRESKARETRPPGWRPKRGERRESSPSPEKDPETAAAELERVRSVLLGSERARIQRVEERQENPAERARDVSEVLSQAVNLSTSKNDALSRSLRPTIESSLNESARRNPKMLADAIFPVLGPAIRKSITSTFQELVQSLQTTLEMSTSPRSWRWRLEAARTGRSFAEVVLYHTLVYRTEQIFLIHNPSGLLLRHVTGANLAIKDEHAVSGMLTAIQDFLKDSFSGDGMGLQTLQMNDLQVWIETAPNATLACVIRGVAPVGFRREMQRVLEEIQGEHETNLRLFDGNTGAFADCEAQLENLRHSEVSTDQGRGKRRSFTAAYVVLGVLVTVLSIWFGWRAIERHRWNTSFAALRFEPGIVISDIRRDGGKYHLSGLRDPLAKEPDEVFRVNGRDPADVVAQWEPYHALTPEFVLHRAHTLLDPPPGISLRLRAGELRVTGPPSTADWLARTKAARYQLAGVTRLVFSADDLEESESEAGFAGEFDQFVVHFADGKEMVSGQDRKLQRLIDLMKVLAAEGRGSDVAHVILRGHTRSLGDPVKEISVSRGRAELMRDWLMERGVAGRLLVVQAAGASLPATDGPEDRVGFKVRMK
jgi:outer membrane protein OmpA-like peptidoglycan-associated protein